MTRDEIQEWVGEAAGKAAGEAAAKAVAEALKAANIVDGPTHLRHHQFLEDFCNTYGQVKKASIVAIVTLLVGGIFTLVILGFTHWSGKGA
jgi:hypothetical protein